MPHGNIKLRSDLVFSGQSVPEGRAFVVKDPASGRFFRFREAEDFILRQLDGTTSLDLVRQRVEERFGREASSFKVETKAKAENRTNTRVSWRKQATRPLAF